MTHIAHEKAEYWYVHLEAGDATAVDFVKFEEWMAANPANKAAFKEVVLLNEAVGTLGHLGALEPLEKPAIWQRKSYMAVAASLLVLIMGTLFMQGEGPPPTPFTTQVAEIRNLILEDGTKVALGARSHMDVSFRADERRVNLKEGEAFFAVTPDKNRPFLVQAGDTLIRVLGTKFNVRRNGGTVNVDVFEGRVEVIKPDTSLLTLKSEHYILTAGQRVKSAHEEVVQQLTNIDPMAVAGWRTGLLKYDNVSLKEVIADANRYSASPIIVMSGALDERAVTMAFGTDQIDQMIESLALLLPIVVEKTDDGRTILRPRD